ncbi:hypothetical protein BC832DRAFT_551497 [Gaertneriomyces semiglobifer]|nr:hypothetical protein BC832DRAFT_551497 [Gaertneriomyces semiglobifer]
MSRLSSLRTMQCFRLRVRSGRLPALALPVNNTVRTYATAKHFSTPEYQKGPRPGEVTDHPPIGKGMDPSDDAVPLKNEGPAAEVEADNDDALRMLSFDKEQTLGTLKGQECSQAPPYESEEAAMRRRGPQQTLQTPNDARGYESTGNAPSDVRVGNMSSFDSEQTLGTLKGQESTNAPPLEEEEEKMRRSGPQLDMQSRSSARGYESTGNAPRNSK